MSIVDGSVYWKVHCHLFIYPFLSPTLVKQSCFVHNRETNFQHIYVGVAMWACHYVTEWQLHRHFSLHKHQSLKVVLVHIRQEVEFQRSLQQSKVHHRWEISSSLHPHVSLWQANCLGNFHHHPLHRSLEGQHWFWDGRQEGVAPSHY